MGKLIKWLNILGYIAMVIVNILANTIPLGGHTTREVADIYPTLFTPASVTFGIWGVIYLSMAIFAIFQLTYSETDTWQKIGPWFFISCLLNITWIICWQYLHVVISAFVIATLLISLLLMDNRLTRTDGLQLIGRLSSVGIELYIGWILIATIGNIAVALNRLNWSHFGIAPEYWTAFAILMGSIIGVFFVLSRRRFFSGLAIIWAIVGILYKHTTPSGYNNQYPVVVLLAIIGIFLIVIAIIRELATARSWKISSHNSP